MAKINVLRNSCKDVYKSFLVVNAEYDGKDEIPRIKKIDIDDPKEIILFSERKNNISKENWIAFYEDDVKFETIWNNPKKYIDILTKYGGIITPDFSTYRDMPLNMQKFNIYRSRALGFWFQDLGINVIPNVRWGDERTFETACLGIEKGSTIAIGSHGTLKNKVDRELFIRGLDYVVEKLEPKKIILYGSNPENIFSLVRFQGIDIVHYPSKTSKIFAGGDN